MPELAASYAVGLIASFCLSGIFIFLWSRYRTRPEIQTLNANLAQVNLYWSERQDRLIPLTNSVDTDDFHSGRRSLWLTTFGLSFLSWAGLLFIVILMISYRFLARSRAERRLLASPLAQPLSVDEVSRYLSEIQTEAPHLFAANIPS